jgi:hypothetical protein
MPRVVTRGLPVLALIAAVAIVLVLGTNVFRTAGTGSPAGSPVSASALASSARPAPAGPRSPARRARRARRKNCFENPETEGTSRIEACGYPGPKNTGVADCAALTPSGSVIADAPGQRVEGLNITGTITVDASRVTINNVCVTANGGGQIGSKAVNLENGATDTTVSDSTIHGENESSKSVEEALANDHDYAGATASNDDLYNCGECIHETWRVSHSYVIVNGMKGTTDHLEDWYFNDTTVSALDDTLLDPQDQTAIMFGDTGLGAGGACRNHLTAIGNLMAGSDYMFYPCGNASSAGTSTTTIADNRFARCLGPTEYQGSTGGTVCAGGPHTNGYFPHGGLYGPVTSAYTGAGQVWQGNYWDNNLEVAHR